MIKMSAKHIRTNSTNTEQGNKKHRQCKNGAHLCFEYVRRQAVVFLGGRGRMRLCDFGQYILARSTGGARAPVGEEHTLASPRCTESVLPQPENIGLIYRLGDIFGRRGGPGWVLYRLELL